MTGAGALGDTLRFERPQGARCNAKIGMQASTVTIQWCPALQRTLAELLPLIIAAGYSLIAGSHLGWLAG